MEIRDNESLLQFKNCHWKSYTIKKPTVIWYILKRTDWNHMEVRVIKESININLPGPPTKLVCFRFGNAALVGSQGKCNLRAFGKQKMCVPQI